MSASQYACSARNREFDSAKQSLADTINTLQMGLGWFPEQPGGLDRYFYDLLQSSATGGLTATGLVVGSSRVHTDSAGRVRAFAQADQSLISRWRKAHKAVDEAIALQNPSCVASHFALYAFPALRQLQRLPHIVHFHGPWAMECRREGDSAASNSIKRFIERQVYRSADRCIALSNAFRRILVDHYGVTEDTVRVIPGGVNADRFDLDTSRREAREKLGWRTDRPIVFCVRRLVPRMGIEGLIDAVSQVAGKHHNVLVLIAGKGPLTESLQKRIDSLNLRDNVRLLGFLPDDQLPLAYRAADLSIVPTESLEGFGLITLESLAAGTPVLVTPVGGLPEAVNGLSEQLVLSGTGAQAIAEGLDGALTGKLFLPTAAECTNYVRANFDWPIIVRRIRDVYEEAIQAHSSR